MLNPWVILTGLAAGTVMGLYFPTTAAILAPGGELYLSLLKMCVVPIMVTAVITSVGRLFLRSGSASFLRRSLAVISAFLLTTSVIGVLSGVLFQPGANMSETSQAVLGRLLTSSGSMKHLPVAPDMIITQNEIINTHPNIFVNFALDMIPTNIFKSLSRGASLQILFFSVLLGIAVAMVPINGKSQFLNDCDVVFQAFVKIIQALMYFLPVGLALLIADQMLSLGMDLLIAMGWYTISIYSGCIFLFLGGSFIIKFQSKESFWYAIKALKQPLIIAFSSRNSFAAMPSAITAMTDDFRFDHTTTNLLIPLGVTMFRFGGLLAFAVSAIFFAQLYHLDLGMSDYILILFTSVLAGVASAGAPSIATASLMTIILNPLGLPSDAAIVLFIAINPVIAPILAMINLHGQCTATALVAPRDNLYHRSQQDPGIKRFL
jgi:proton glutamate symport protein